MKIQLVEIEAWNGSGVVTLRFATHGYVTARSDTPADTSYAARIAAPVTLTRNSTSADRTGGASALSIGTLDLVNTDGTLDGLLTYAYAGRPLRVRLVEQGAALSTAVLLFEGLMEQPQFDWAVDGSGALRFIVRDQALSVEQPVQANAYAGSNSLPSGLEGVAELKGKYKPLLFGHAQQIDPPCVNTTRLIYQISDGAIYDVPAAYDSGLALTRGADYASQADMETNNPAAGAYRVWLAGGMMRIGSTPKGLITCDATEGATAASRYPGAVMARVLTACGIASGSIDATALAALDTACPWQCGYWAVDDAGTLGTRILDALADSVGGWWAACGDAVFRAGKLVAPTGAAEATLHAGNLLALTRRQAKSTDKGVPPWRVTVGYARYWHAQDVGVDIILAADKKSDLQQGYRTSSASDGAIQTAYPAAPEIRIDTLLRYAADAATLAAARLSVLGVKRDLLRAEAVIADAAGLDIGSIVEIVLPRFGLDAGKKFLVTGVTLDPRIDRVTLTLWG